MTHRFWRSQTPNTPEPGARQPLSLPPLSLLWPGPPLPNSADAEGWDVDLGLNEVIAAFDFDKRYAPFARKILTALVADPDVIRWRQAVLRDFHRYPALVARVEALLPRLMNMRQGSALLGGRRRNLLLETSDRLAELDLYIEAVVELAAALGQAALESPALLALREALGALLADPQFQNLRAELPELRAPLGRIASLTIGVNLDPDLRPLSAVLLGVGERPFGENQSFLERLIGLRLDADDESGVAALHRLPDDPDLRPFDPLFQDMERLMREVAAPVARALGRYARISSASLAALEPELAFFTAAARLIARLEARGVPFCQPDIAPPGARITELRGLVNLTLCLRSAACPVASDAIFDDAGRIAVLTGPNSGGKTTYLSAVGLAHALAQAGLFVPAQAARLSPIDRLLTHFPQPETRTQGRLAEESARLRGLFAQVTPHSLVLLNETFSSTAFGEALYLAHDLLCGLRAAGARAIYATHLVELAERLDEVEAAVAGDSRPFSLVAGIDLGDLDGADGEARPNYQVTRGLPLGRSYAQEIARRHGISLRQILDALNGRASGG